MRRDDKERLIRRARKTLANGQRPTDFIKHEAERLHTHFQTIWRILVESGVIEKQRSWSKKVNETLDL